jgi:hypothetical protein
MDNLKKENVTKCFSLLREFIDGADPENSKKGMAVLALNQLQKITAGTGGGSTESTGCWDRPRAS